MADKPTGPLKPPTLDLKARKPDGPPPAASKPDAPQPDAKPATASTAPGPQAEKSAAPASPPKQPETKAPEPPARPAPASGKTSGDSSAPGLPFLPLAATAVGGAALGLAAAYGLAVAGLWPAGPSGLAPLETRLARTENALEANAASLAGLADRLGRLETAPAPEIPALPDDLLTTGALAEVTAQIDALGLRIDAVAAGLPGDEAAQLASEIARLGSGLADIETRLDEPDEVLDSLSADLSALSSRLQTLEARAADQAAIDAMRAERDRFASLPGAASTLETAIGSGQPFGAELAALEALMPELGVTNPARAIAASGVKPLREIARDFKTLIPALLAARPENPGAGWFDTLVGQAQSAIALRPVDDEADTPEAMIGRIETALENGEAGEARALILSLPEPMQATALPVRTDLDAVIAAHGLLADIRALAPQGPGENGQ